jgi:hypothetical protein
MANGDVVDSNQDVFHNEPYDSLAFSDTQRISSTAQPVEERRSIIGLVSDCLQLGTERLIALAQRRHSLTHLLDRHECSW